MSPGKPVALPRGEQTAAMPTRSGLRTAAADSLSIKRRKNGHGFVYHTAAGRRISDASRVRRLASLAVPPAYTDVRFADDPAAHLQAVGRDAAGRLQYRYHPAWTLVREERKARRLARIVKVLPRIRRKVAGYLRQNKPTRELAQAAVVELVTQSSIRAGRESYARIRGTRGAATLLKSNVAVSGNVISLNFRAKGGKKTNKQFRAGRLCSVIRILRQLPGRRLFQYSDETGGIHAVKARDVNAFLCSLGDVKISLKDFRTLCACAAVIDVLSGVTPAVGERKRRQQVREAVRLAAAELDNTPAVCRKSYVHDAIVTAFEKGWFIRSEGARNGRSRAQRERLLARVFASASALSGVK